jgi:hypothetical protein
VVDSYGSKTEKQQMKKIIAAGLMTGMAITGLAVGAGTAQATPYCATGWYEFSSGTCTTGPGCGSSCNPDLAGPATPSRPINGCDLNTVEGFKNCLGGGQWE